MRTNNGANRNIRINSRAMIKIGITWFSDSTALGGNKNRNLIETHLYPMAIIGLPPGTIGVLFIPIYDPPGQSYISCF